MFNCKCIITQNYHISRISSIANGLSLEQLAAATGISRSALGSYETAEIKEVGSENLRALAQYHHVSTDYLHGLTDNVDLSELKLNDETILLLKNGHFNHRLLCEIIGHPDFKKFLADIEIYINGIATSQIHALNSIIDFARQQIA